MISLPSQAEAGPSSALGGYAVGHRYLHAKTRRPLTVRYIGPLPPSPSTEISGGVGQWLGVEYDDPAHGKGHDGMYKDVRVFQTREPGSAAFLKLVGRPLVEGSTLVDSIEERYGRIVPTNSQDPHPRHDPRSTSIRDRAADASLPSASASASAETVVLGSSNEAIVVEAPNLSSVRERVGKLERLRNMGFEEESIRSLGGDEVTRRALRERMRGLKWLNLSRNLIPTWQGIAEIVSHLEGLSTLTLSHSRISISSLDEASEEYRAGIRTVFERIKEVDLSDCLLSSDELRAVLPLFSNLEVLHLEANRLLTNLVLPLEGLERVKELRLGGCPLTSWEEVALAITGTPGLETLDLSFTNIVSVPPPSDRKSEQTTPSTELKSLTMLSSGLQRWSDLDNLSLQFPLLDSLRFSLPPESLESGHGSAEIGPRAITRDEKLLRLVCIAKFPNIGTFNSTAITANERRDAELFYVGYVRKSLHEGEGGSTQSPIHDMTRWEALCTKYGVDVADTKAVGSGAKEAQGNKVKLGLKGKMIDLHIHTPDDQIIPLSILPSASIALLQKKIARLITLPIAEAATLKVYSVFEDAGKWEKAVRIGGENGEDVGWWFSDGDGVLVELASDEDWV